MGQFVAKIKQMVERLEWNNDKKSSFRLSKSLQTSTTDLDVILHSKEKKVLSEVLSKLELIETVVENQSQLIGHQEAKLQALENTVKSAHEALETLKQPINTDCPDKCEEAEQAKDKSLGRIFDSFFQETKSRLDEELTTSEQPPSQVLQEHTQALKNHEGRLKAAIDKIESIWDTIVNEKDQRASVKDVQKELKDIKKLVESLRKHHDALKTESQDEFHMQQKILDNLFSGFVVAFLLLVFICMFHK